MRTICIVLAVSVLATAPGSASWMSFMDRSFAAENIARKAGFTKEYITAGGFTLMTYRRFKDHSGAVRIYIEGDGRAWEARGRLSDDPTPSDPIALRLAAADSAANVAYIARPGQFPDTDSPGCDPTYWSQRRFAPEVIESFDKAIDALKKESGASHVELVGYSGGGAIAVLVAARRDDVAKIRTIAGNLDPEAFCGYHHVSRLEGSMDPLDYAQKVAHIPQRHFVGSDDRVVPAFIARGFAVKAGDRDDERVTVVFGATHTNGWQARWPELLAMPVG